MITTAFVNIWNTRVGAIAWDDLTGIGSFEFEPAFLTKNWDLSPVMMPVSEARGRIFSFVSLRDIRSFRGLPGLLADTLPDRYGNALIDAWLARRGRASGSMNPVEILCFTGSRGIGALEYEPVIPGGSDVSTKVEIDELVTMANEILEGRRNFSAALSSNEEKEMLDIIKIGTSAGGARAKAVIAFNPETMEVRSGQTEAPEGFTHWLIKFDGVSDSQLGATHGYGRVEMAYYLMARDAAIEMTECRLLEENERAHFMTRRFDRQPDNAKIHTQSLFAMQHYDFNDINSYSYEMLFETMRLLGLPYPQAEQLFRRMVFNVLARNCDDHTKNFAFMMERDGEWKLAPAYDICHAYRPGSPWVSRQSLSINGKRENITYNDFILVAKRMNIRKARNIILDVNGVIGKWLRYASLTGTDTALAGAIEKTLIRIE